MDIKSAFKGTSVYIFVCVVLAVLLVLSVLTAVSIGSTNISAGDVYRVISYELLHAERLSEFGKGAVHDVVWLIRMPRIILAVAAGMGLSVCGAVMQAVVKNPLADPYILGISSGASLGATLAVMTGIASFLGSNSIGIMAFLGAFAASQAVMLLANMGGRADSVRLVLAGMALSSVCSAFSSFIVFVSKDKEGIQTITYWLMGSLAGAKWSTIGFVLPVILIGTLFFISQFRTLNMMLLGDEVSITLGKNLQGYRYVYMLVSTLMVGLIVYSSGMIGFLGLIIPHMGRIIFGTDHRRLLVPVSLFGAIFLIWCDVLCRIIIRGSEMPIGILVSSIGAPCFIYLMTKKAYGFGGAR